MKLKDHIADAARTLFNLRGVRNVTLRDVANHLGRSYGNITYHYPDKELLLFRLYEDYLGDLEVINRVMAGETDPLAAMMKAPYHTFELSMNHLFFFVDFVEIRRAYPMLSERIDADNEQRMQVHLKMLLYLQSRGILRSDLTPEDLRYLMELSGAVRTFFFLRLRPEEVTDPGLQQKYVDSVNRLLIPYLPPL